MQAEVSVAGQVGDRSRDRRCAEKKKTCVAELIWRHSMQVILRNYRERHSIFGTRLYLNAFLTIVRMGTTATKKQRLTSTRKTMNQGTLLVTNTPRKENSRQEYQQ